MSGPVPEKPNTRIVCAGERAGKDDKPWWAWYELDESGRPVVKPSPLGFSGKPFRDAVGMVYEAAKSEDGETWQKRSYVGTLASPDAGELCARWKAEEAAARVRIRAAADMRKGKSRDWIDELLAPLRDAYLSADPLGREVIVAHVIRRITRGRP